MSCVVHGDADHVGVLLFDRGNDVVGGLAEPQVDDLHARIAEHSCHHLEPAIVAVQPQFGENHPDREAGVDHQATAVST